MDDSPGKLRLFPRLSTGLRLGQKAERCYKFELGIDNTFIGFGYWDNLKKGLQSADLCSMTSSAWK